MPTTRRRRVRSQANDIHPIVIAFLRDEDPDPADYGNGANWALTSVEYSVIPNHLRQIYDRVKDNLIAGFARDFPGTRPVHWWKFSAPEMRQRIGGTGSLLEEHLAHVPAYHLGIPYQWACEALIRMGWPTVHINGHPEGWAALPGLANAIAFDHDDPPRFESQATYLQRLGLLLPGERKRLKPSDFEPELATHEQCLACSDYAKVKAKR
jgi:hypothetical protein